MEKKLFYLLDTETNKTIPTEAVRKERQAQWESLCAKCKGSSRTLIISDKLNIFHCYKCGWKGTLNNLDRPKQPVKENKKQNALLSNSEKENQSSGAIISELPDPEPDDSIFKTHWKEYFDLGLPPYPADKKRPIVKLQNDATGEYIRYSKEDCERWAEENPHANIWVLIGSKFVIFDPDGPLAEAFVQSLNLPKCPTAKSGGKSRHRYFKTSEPLDFLVLKFEKDDKLEVRTGPIGIMVPPSIHPETGRAYQWEPGHSPREIPFPEFPKEAYEKIEAKIPPPKMSKPCGDNNDSDLGRFDVEKYLSDYGIDYKPKQRGDRILYLLRRCLWSAEHGHGDKPGHGAIIQNLSSGKLGYKCFHNSCFEKTWHEARQAISGEGIIVKYCEVKNQPSSQENSTGVNIPMDKNRQSKNIAEELRMWVDNAYGNFTSLQIYTELNISAPADKRLCRVTLHRLVESGEIERGLTNGTYRKIDREAMIIEIKDTISNPLPVKWPGGLEKYVKIMRKSTIGVAGTMQAGKTAYLLNVAWDNRNLMKTFYFSSEFGADELRQRLEGFPYLLDGWRKITFIEKSRDFQDVIDPDGLNVIDYLEVSDEGEFYKMGIQIKRIYEKLRDGIAVIGLQKKFGSDFGYGGQPTADKPRLYISLEKQTLKIVKAKLWATTVNPDGMTRKFNLVQGARFLWDEWQIPQV
ncbi:MAG: bifunctional DNA primase/polymerase [Thermodesulfobacteriota bacterium]|jgi:hypothetical protein